MKNARKQEGNCIRHRKDHSFKNKCSKINRNNMSFLRFIVCHADVLSERLEGIKQSGRTTPRSRPTMNYSDCRRHFRGWRQ